MCECRYTPPPPPRWLADAPDGVSEARFLAREGLLRLDILCALDSGARYDLIDAMDAAIKHALTTYTQRRAEADAFNAAFDAEISAELAAHGIDPTNPELPE